MKIDIYNTTKKYQIIYADPPWKYGGDGGSKWRPANEYYQTMTFDEIKAMAPAIKQITDEKNCLLFMWVVSSQLDKCIEVGKAWDLII